MIFNLVQAVNDGDFFGVLVVIKKIKTFSLFFDEVAFIKDGFYIMHKSLDQIAKNIEHKVWISVHGLILSDLKNCSIDLMLSIFKNLCGYLKLMVSIQGDL